MFSWNSLASKKKKKKKNVNCDDKNPIWRCVIVYSNDLLALVFPIPYMSVTSVLFIRAKIDS